MTDLQLARDKQQGFEDWKRENAADKPLAMDLQVTVLTTGFWPSYKVCTTCHTLNLLRSSAPQVLKLKIPAPKHEMYNYSRCHQMPGIGC